MERLKKKKDDDEQDRLNAVFEQYRDDFEQTKSHGNTVRSFVRGGIINQDKTDSLPSSALNAAPKRLPNAAEARRLADEAGRKIMLEAQKHKLIGNPPIQLPSGASSAAAPSKPPAAVIPTNRPPKPGARKDTQKQKVSNLELFKRELKSMQEQRQERRGLRQQLKKQFGDDADTIDRLAPSLDNPYLHGQSEYADDPNTTNLYLSSLPLDVEMEDLYETFGTFGPLSSAKILYPRSDDERRKATALSGFIAFMSRVDAERAINDMAQATIRDTPIRVAWARPVAAGGTPVYVPPALRELCLPDPPSNLPFNARPQPSDLRHFLDRYKQLPPLGTPLPTDANPDMLADYEKMLSGAVVRVVIPTERPLLGVIHRVIEFLVSSGPMFEALIMERERMNPVFRFLFDNNHPTHVYYRWKLYSVLNGEDKYNWRLERFRMFKNGSWWEPPPHTLLGAMPQRLYTTAYRPAKLGNQNNSQSMSRRRSRSRSRSPSTRRSSARSDESRSNRSRKRSHEHDYEDDERRRRGELSRSEREFLENLLRALTPEKLSIGDAMVWCIDHSDCAKEIVECITESLEIKETPLHKKIARFYLINDILANCGLRIKDVMFYRKFIQDFLERIFIALNRALERIESRIKAEQFRQRVMLCFRHLEANAVYPRDVLINWQNIFLGLKREAEAASDDDDDVDGVPMNEDEDVDGEPLKM